MIYDIMQDTIYWYDLWYVWFDLWFFSMIRSMIGFTIWSMIWSIIWPVIWSMIWSVILCVIWYVIWFVIWSVISSMIWSSLWSVILSMIWSMIPQHPGLLGLAHAVFSSYTWDRVFIVPTLPPSGVWSSVQALLPPVVQHVLDYLVVVSTAAADPSRSGISVKQVEGPAGRAGAQEYGANRNYVCALTRRELRVGRVDVASYSSSDRCHLVIYCSRLSVTAKSFECAQGCDRFSALEFSREREGLPVRTEKQG